MTAATTSTATPAAGWGPAACRGAFSLTFDNLGEAAALERGLPVSEDVRGRHPSAAYLPRLIDLLDGLPCTYFVEACNTGMYPDAIRGWADAGQEIGIHAWRHEHWAAVETPRRKELLQRSMDAFAAMGLRPRGFRPPGGEMPEGALQEFLDAGLDYCSPLGGLGDTTVEAGVAVMPFAWRHVDAFMLSPDLGWMREQYGFPGKASTLDEWEQELRAGVDFALAHGRHVTVVLHPGQLVDPGKHEVLRRHVALLKSTPGLWVASCSQVADWLGTSSASLSASPSATH
ncbi:MAG: polysaccharide deacetylase family protein [Pseudomonadota bacterium]